MEKEKDMTPILLEDLGMRYSTEKSKRRYRYGLYQCQYCGNEFITQTHDVKRGKIKSCRCQSIKHRNVHGLKHHRLYETWSNMKNRCYNPTHVRYDGYGERGIQVCDRWLNIANFIEDMYPSYQEGLTLDRIDVNGNYEPENCRWTTKEVQARNTREIYKHNTSGFRGVCFNKKAGKWQSQISVENRKIYLGIYSTALEAAKAYERYVRLNNLEHNFTPALTEEEIEELDKKEKGK